MSCPLLLALAWSSNVHSICLDDLEPFAGWDGRMKAWMMGFAMSCRGRWLVSVIWGVKRRATVEETWNRMRSCEATSNLKRTTREPEKPCTDDIRGSRLDGGARVKRGSVSASVMSGCLDQSYLPNKLGPHPAVQSLRLVWSGVLFIT